MASTAGAFWFMRTATDVYWMVPLMGFCQLAVFGGYAIYFPELFPNHLRSTGAGFCFNAGRVLASTGPFLAGILVIELGGFGRAVSAIALIYLVGLALVPFAPETKGRPLPD